MSPTMFIDVTDIHGKPDQLPVREYVRNLVVAPADQPHPVLLERLHDELGEQ